MPGRLQRVKSSRTGADEASSISFAEFAVAGAAAGLVEDRFFPAGELNRPWVKP